MMTNAQAPSRLRDGGIQGHLRSVPVCRRSSTGHSHVSLSQALPARPHLHSDSHVYYRQLADHHSHPARDSVKRSRSPQYAIHHLPKTTINRTLEPKNRARSHPIVPFIWENFAPTLNAPSAGGIHPQPHPRANRKFPLISGHRRTPANIGWMHP